MQRIKPIETTRKLALSDSPCKTNIELQLLSVNIRGVAAELKFVNGDS